MTTINGAATRGLLKSAVLFDVYKPHQGITTMQSGEKSLAVRLVLGSETATLTEETIETIVQTILSALQQNLQARQRV